MARRQARIESHFDIQDAAASTHYNVPSDPRGSITVLLRQWLLHRHRGVLPLLSFRHRLTRILAPSHPQAHTPYRTNHHHKILRHRRNEAARSPRTFTSGSAWGPQTSTSYRDHLCGEGPQFQIRRRCDPTKDGGGNGKIWRPLRALTSG